MTNLKHRQEKIQEKRKNTPWREFVKTIVPRQPLNFYKVNGKISRMPENDRITLFCEPDEFWDNADQNITTIDYSENIEENGFFSTLHSLWKATPLPRVRQGWGSENVDYSDVAFDVKNCYLSFVVFFKVENSMYSFNVGGNVADVVGSIDIKENSQIIFESAGVVNSMKVFYSRYIVSSNNIWFSANLVGCSDCILCSGLENASYCILNKQYTKEEYKKLREEILSKKESYNEYKENTFIQGNNIGSSNSGGSYVVDCEDVQNSKFALCVSGGNNNLFVGQSKDHTLKNSYDNVLSGNDANHVYGCHGVSPGEHIYCSMNTGNATNVYYSYFLVSCSYCFGCVGLVNKQYCIFNKQYTKEERNKKIDEIFSQMETEGILGEFFPGSMNPFYFNDTASCLVDDTFTKEEMEAEGYLRRDEEIKVDIPEGVDVIPTNELNEYEGRMIDGEFVTMKNAGTKKGERTIHPDILKKVIQDEEGNCYRIIPMEYKFLKKYGLPLPRKHWLERMKDNFTINEIS